MGIGTAFFVRRIRFFSGGSGCTMYSSGGYGGNYVLWIDGYWTHLAETLSNAGSYDTCFAPGLLGRDWSVILANLLLNWSTMVADVFTSFRQM